MSGIENINMQLNMLGSSATRPIEPIISAQAVDDTESDNEECATGTFDISANVSYSQESFS